MGIPYAEVIGDPISHSKSPLIHDFWAKGFSPESRPRYRATKVPTGALADYLAARRQDPDWLGCNVTRPHKQAILDLVPETSGLRSWLGAANLVLARGGLSAINSDYDGVRRPLLSCRLEGKRAIVIGAGGAARAALAALRDLKPASVSIMSRSPATAAALIEAFGLAGESLPLGAPIPEAELLINATPLGMAGEPALDVDLSPLVRRATVFDMVYEPAMTRLLEQASSRGLATIDGLTMLIEQAAISFELFHEVRLDRDQDVELRRLLTS